jgi:hypothetical protein
MTLEEIGKTSYGQPMLMAIVSSPANLKKRQRYRKIAERLCHARGIDRLMADQLADEGRAVIWIDAGMHATESVAAQNIIELTYRMCSRNDAETRRILDNVILLVCPANPDGMEMVANAYMATGRVGGLPVLYQRYVGHDNNRDFYASNQKETRAINRMLYRRWFPQIIYNHHQSAPRGTVIFTPPFRDPFNYNVDPRVVRGIEIVSAHMTHRFARENKPGVISRTGAPYSTWWNGGLRTTTYFHNMIGILTESFGHPTPRKLTQALNRRLPYGDYPMPVATQTWHARQTIEYLQTANLAILDYASRYRKELLFDIWQMGKAAIAKGRKDHWTVTPRLVAEAKKRKDNTAFTDPELRDARAYVLPADQLDLTAVRRFIDRLVACGVEVHRASADFGAGFARFPKGSWVVLCDQAFRAHVRDMFEPQWHPDDLGNGGEPVRPYDSAGWTLAMQMGVQFDRVYDRIQAKLERVEDVGVDAGSVTDGSAGWLFTHYDGGSYRAMNHLLSLGDRVHWLRSRTRIGGRAWPAGTCFVENRAGGARRVRDLAKRFGVSFTGILKRPPSKLLEIRRPRIGLFDVFGGNMPTGWTQFVLQEFGFTPKLVFGKRVAEGDLRKDFDVLLFCTGLPNLSQRPRSRRPVRISDATIEKLQKALPAFEDWSNISDRRVVLTKSNALAPLEKFVSGGGTLIAIGGQASAAIRMFDFPVRTGTFVDGDGGKPRATNRSEFFIPGSLVRLAPAKGLMLTWGVQRNLVGMFRRSPVFEATEDSSQGSAQVAVRYTKKDTLASGWAIGTNHLHGKAAVLSMSFGAGNVFLFGPDMLYRGQPDATFKLVFNAILGGPARAE